MNDRKLKARRLPNIQKQEAEQIYQKYLYLGKQEALKYKEAFIQGGIRKVKKLLKK